MLVRPRPCPALGRRGVHLPAVLPAGSNGGYLLLLLGRESVPEGFEARVGHGGRGAERRKGPEKNHCGYDRGCSLYSGWKAMMGGGRMDGWRRGRFLGKRMSLL